MPEGSALLLPTNPEQTRSNDTQYRFRPASDFYYLCGFPEPGAWALLRKGLPGPSFVLFVQPKDPTKEVWHGVRAGTAGAVSDYGAQEAFSVDTLESKLPELLAPAEKLYFSFGRDAESETKVNGILAKLRGGRKAALGPVSIEDASTLLAEFRLFKTAAELTLMRRGAAVTAEAHSLAMAQVRPGMYEYELDALIEYTFRRQGAWGPAYTSIVGSGANACILHYVENNAKFRQGDLVLIDAGAEIDGYATDVTRTFPVSGKFKPQQAELYDAVLRSQEEAIAATVPGATIGTIHDGVVRSLTESMVSLGLLDGEVDSLIETDAYKRYYMHRTSHWIGLDVHDVGRYKERGGDERPLKPGMVLTIEPGLYIPADDELAPKSFRGVGIRIEDDILVTKDGHENLTAATPKTVAEIEALRD
jgi:Xaa-Pro aminopeptidase